MTARILCIQFRENEELIDQEQACLQREVGTYSEIHFLSALDESVRWGDPASLLSGYQGLILGGSGEFYFDGNREETDRNRQMSYHFLKLLTPLFTHVFTHDIPTLGICYGHQLLGAFAGAQVRFDEAQGKSRSQEVKLLVDQNDYFLFSDVPESFQAHYGHKDALDRVPDGAVLLMSGGDRCQVSALKYKNNIYTTQFHPELKFDDMVNRMRNAPGYLPEGVVAEEIFKDDPNSNKILHNFGKFVAMKAEAVTPKEGL